MNSKGLALLEIVIAVVIVALFVGGGFYLKNVQQQQNMLQISNDAVKQATEVQQQTQVRTNQENDAINQLNQVATSTTAEVVPSCTFSAVPPSILVSMGPLASAKLTWTCQHASACSISSDNNENLASQTSTKGTLSVAPRVTTDYTLACRNASLATSTNVIRVPVIGPSGAVLVAPSTSSIEDIMKDATTSSVVIASGQTDLDWSQALSLIKQCRITGFYFNDVCGDYNIFVSVKGVNLDPYYHPFGMKITNPPGEDILTKVAQVSCGGLSIGRGIPECVP